MNVYELVTSRIIERLEEGVIPWRKCWMSSPAKSLTTGKEYRGINSILLGMGEFSSRYWTTFKQARKLGGHVKKGEKATPVVFWHWRTPEEMAKLQAHGKAAAPAPCYPFVAFVFNLDQTEEIERPGDDVPTAKIYPLEEAQKIVDGMPNRPEIRHGASLNPCYKPAIDVIEMPNMGQFEDGEGYFAALLHEAVHSTGHKSRLNRFEKREGESREERYGFEELVAELGAAFLSATCSLDNSSRLDDASAYLAGWLKALRDDRKLLLQAASAAQKAADYILGKADEQTEEGRAAA
jgi:antirestriction protein ArdC